MSRTQDLETLIAHTDQKWGAMNKEGDAAVSGAMMLSSNKLTAQTTKEEDAGARFSLAKRLEAIEDGVAKFREESKSHPDSGLMNSEVRGQVFDYLGSLLATSGVEETLAREMVQGIRYGGFVRKNTP